MVMNGARKKERQKQNERKRERLVKKTATRERRGVKGSDGGERRPIGGGTIVKGWADAKEQRIQKKELRERRKGWGQKDRRNAALIKRGSSQKSSGTLFQSYVKATKHPPPKRKQVLCLTD